MFDSIKVTLWSLFFIDLDDLYAQLRLLLPADDALLFINPQPSAVHKNGAPRSKVEEHMRWKCKGNNSIHHPVNQIHGFAESDVRIWRHAWLKTQKCNFYPMGSKCVFYTMNFRDAYDHYISLKLLAPYVFSSSGLLSDVGICQRERGIDILQFWINGPLSPFL